MLLQLIDVPHWFLINIFLCVGFSWYLQALVHWCGFHETSAGVKVNGAYYCNILLLKQLLPDICQAAGDFCFPVHQSCARAMSCCDTRLRTSHQMWPPNRPDFSSVEYRLLRVIQECVCQKQKGMSNVVDELWLLTE